MTISWGAGAGLDGRVLEEDNDLTQFTPAASAAPRNGAYPPDSDRSGGALLEAILASLDDDKAEEVVAIALAGKSEMADHMVIATGRSSRQVGAIAENLANRLKAEHGLIVRMEGRELGDWVLIDAGDVIVHVFRPEVREFYQLEKMWSPEAARPRPADAV